MPVPEDLQLDLGTRVARVPPVLSTEVEGEVVMMDMESGLYYGLDAVGSDIWRRLETPATVADLAAALSGTYAADPGAIGRDLSAFLLRMAEHGLVKLG